MFDRRRASGMGKVKSEKREVRKDGRAAARMPGRPGRLERLAPKRFSAAVAERRAVKRALRELARGGAELEAEI